MMEGVVYLVGSFWLGAVHAATPGHGKTIAAAYIVGARGRPADAFALGVFVTLSHTFGIVLVAVVASLGAAWAVPARVEAYLALTTGLLVVGIGLGCSAASGRLSPPRARSRPTTPRRRTPTGTRRRRITSTTRAPAPPHT